jgi:hypothetical protein
MDGHGFPDRGLRQLPVPGTPTPVTPTPKASG